MLTCQEVAAKASSMIDGELGFWERAAVQLHLTMCTNCRRFTRQLKALVSSMASRRSSKPEEIPLNFVSTVMRRFDGARDSLPSSSRHNDD